MKELLKDLYRLNNEQYRLLRKRMTDEQMLEQRDKFKIGEISKPVTVWRLFYYIDKYGNFTEDGKLKHHHIARAIYESMSAKRKREILEYIDGHERRERANKKRSA